MVGVAGRSKGCNTCRARKIACGLQRPQCAQCIKSNRFCGGYQRQPVFIVNQGNGQQGRKQATSTKAGDTSRNSLPHRGKFVSTNRAMPIDFQESQWSQEVFNRKHSLYALSSTSAHRQQLYSLFISCFLPLDHVGSMPKKAWILQIADIANPTEVLKQASLAFCLARLGNVHDDDSFRRESLKLYTKGLFELQKALYDPSLMYSDETLAACLLLSFYELWECPDRTHYGYVSHNRGCARLIEKRGPEAHTKGLGHAIFAAFRGPGLLQTMEDQAPGFLSSPEWCTIPWKYTPKTALDRIWDVLALAPGIYGRTSQFDRQEPITRLKNALEVIDALWQIDAAQLRFFEELEESIPGPLYWPELSVLNNPADDGHHGKLFPVAFHFSNLRVAQTVMIYWAARMMAWNGLIHIYLLVSTTEVDLRTIHRLGIKFAYDGIKPCDKDCPCRQDSLFPCFTHFDMSKLPPLGQREQFVTLARNIFQSAEYCLKDEMLDTGPAQTAAPVNIAIDILKYYPKYSRYVLWGKEILIMIQNRSLKYMKYYIERLPLPDDPDRWRID